MTTFINNNEYHPATDCNGERIRVGDVVYLPAGWTGTKPNRWHGVVVGGITSPASGRPWLHIEGYDMRTVPAHIVCKYQPVPDGPVSAYVKA